MIAAGAFFAWDYETDPLVWAGFLGLFLTLAAVGLTVWLPRVPALVVTALVLGALGVELVGILRVSR
jgi:hypothetical protein